MVIAWLVGATIAGVWTMVAPRLEGEHALSSWWHVSALAAAGACAAAIAPRHRIRAGAAVAIAPALVTTLVSALNRPAVGLILLPSGFNLAVLAFLAAAIPCTAGAVAAVLVRRTGRLFAERRPTRGA